MRLTFFVVWKSWVSNKVRTLLTILGVALGIAVVTAIHVLDHNTIQSQLQMRMASYGRVDLELVPKDGSRTPVQVREQLQGMPELIRSVGLLHGGSLGASSIAAKAPLDQSSIPTSVRLFGLSPLPSESFALYHVLRGEDLVDLDGDEKVLIGEPLAAFLDVDVGDELVVAPPPGGSTKRCKDGELVSVGTKARPGETLTVKIKGVLSKHALAGVDQGRVIVGSFSFAHRVAPFAPSFYQVNRVEGANPDLLRTTLEKDFQVLDERSALLGEGSDERAFRNGIKMLGMLALVLGMLVVFQTLSQTLLERLKQIGLMRCLGTSRRAVTAIFLLDGLLLALVGAVLGVALGIGLAYVMGYLKLTTLGVGKNIIGFEVPPRPVLFAAGLGILFTLAGCAFPLFKARNLPPVRVLQSRGLGDSGYLLRGVNVFLFLLLVLVLPISYLAMTPLLTEEGRETQFVLLQVGGIVLLFGAVLLMAPNIVRTGGRLLLKLVRRRLPLPTFMVDKNIARSPGRFSAAVCGLAVVLVALLALKHITYALRAEVRQFSAQSMDDHLFFWVSGPRATEMPPKKVSEVEGVRGITGVRSAEFFAGMVNAGFQLRGIPVDCLAREGGILEGDAQAIADYRDTRCLIVSKRWAELKNVDKHYEILTPGSGAQNFRILRQSDSAGFFPDEKVWAITSPSWLRKDYCVPEASVTHIALGTDPGSDPNKIRAEVKKIFPHTNFKKGNDIRNYLVRDVTADFFLFEILLLLILILVGVGLVNTMTIAAVGRAREIGVLRALGMEDSALRRTFLVEGGVVAVLAAGVAIAMGLPLGHIVVEGLNRVAGLEAPVVVPWLYVGLVPVLALITGVLAAILPASRAIKMNPSEAVRYE